MSVDDDVIITRYERKQEQSYFHLGYRIFIQKKRERSFLYKNWIIIIIIDYYNIQQYSDLNGCVVNLVNRLTNHRRWERSIKVVRRRFFNLSKKYEYEKWQLVKKNKKKKLRYVGWISSDIEKKNNNNSNLGRGVYSSSNLCWVLFSISIIINNFVIKKKRHSPIFKKKQKKPLYLQMTRIVIKCVSSLELKSFILFIYS